MGTKTQASPSTVPGFKGEKPEACIQSAEGNPGQVLLSLQARTNWEGRSGESLIKTGLWKLAGEEINRESRDFSIQYGALKEVEEEIALRSRVHSLVSNTNTLGTHIR